MFTDAHVDAFDAIIRKKGASQVRRVRVSQNAMLILNY